MLPTFTACLGLSILPIVTALNHTFYCSFEDTCVQLTKVKLPNVNYEREFGATDGLHAPNDYYPSVDHTSGNSSGWYRFIALSDNPTTTERTPASMATTVKLSYYPTQYCLSFAYSLTGPYPSLTVQFVQSAYTLTTAAKLTDATYPAQWKTKQLTLPNDDFTIRIIGDVGQHRASRTVIAIDDVRVAPCGTNKPPETLTMCTFDKSGTGTTCGATRGALSSEPWQLARGVDHVSATPATDATSWTSRGYYMYAEALGKTDTAYLDFPPVSPTGSGPWCLTFHVWVSRVKSEIGLYKFVVLNLHDSQMSTVLWTGHKDDFIQGEWNSISIPIKTGPTRYRFVINDIYATAAIDNVSVKQCPVGRDPPTTWSIIGKTVFDHSICDFEDDAPCVPWSWPGESQCQWQLQKVQAGTEGAPAVDHTYGNSSGHVFLAKFVPPYKSYNAACMKTPEFLAMGYCVELYYYMSGKQYTEGSLSASVGGSVGGGTWPEIKGNKGNQWHKAVFEVVNGYLYLTLASQLRSAVPPVIALDDIRIDRCTAFRPRTTTPHPTKATQTLTMSSTTPSTSTTTLPSTPTTTSSTAHPQTSARAPTPPGDRSTEKPQMKPEREEPDAAPISSSSLLTAALVPTLIVIAILVIVVGGLIWYIRRLKTRMGFTEANNALKMT